MQVSTLAGNGTVGFVDGIDTLAQFNYTRGVVTDSSGNKIYVVDFNNHSIRIIQVIEGIEENEDKSYSVIMYVYPNPNKGIFNLAFKKIITGQTANLKLFDILGVENILIKI